MDEVELNFSSLCSNSSDDLCYIDYTIPNELKVESEDFVGFYTANNSLARPSFSSTEKNTTFSIFNSEPDRITKELPLQRFTDSMETYDLQMIGTFVCLYKQFSCCGYVYNNVYEHNQVHIIANYTLCRDEQY